MAEKDPILKEAFDLIKHSWLHRKGNEIHAAVQDTLDALYAAPLKPLIVKKIKKSNGWQFIIYLPPGIAYSEFRQKQDHIQDATGGAVQMERKGKAVVLDVMTEPLKNRYEYSWDPEPYEKMNLPVPFGYSALGLIVRDLADAPNLICAGHPGAGKSNFLHVLAVSLLTARKIQMVIIDLKRLEFAYLKSSALVVTDLPAAQNVLAGINKELDKRLEILEKAGVVKIQDYPGDMPFVVLLVDELAELQDEECQDSLNRIVRLGRAAGVCVVAATQRPSSTMFKKFGDSKAMFSATMCFHVRDEVNSRMLLDDDRAALIPNIPGRAIYQWERELEVQEMYLPIRQARELVKDIKGVKWVADKSPKRLPPR